MRRNFRHPRERLLYNNFKYAAITSALTATNTTISGNSAARDGGGVYNITGTLSLYNATVADNRANSDADGVGDGGGIMRASGTVALQNTILGANADRGGQAGDCAGMLLSQGYNLIQDTAGCTITGPATADIVGQPPLLVPLGDNGGPTPTHALLLDSPAIDAGDPAGCRDAQGIPLTIDQRGAARPQGGACDIGAFESTLTPRATTTTALNSSGNPTVVGETIFFTATVGTPVPGTPTGSVMLKDGATILATSPLSTSGQAFFITAALVPGSHSITAAYGGDADFSGSVSPPLTQQVDTLSTTIELDDSANPSTFGQTATFTATIHPAASGIPTGTVTFRDGAAVLGSGTLNNGGQASFSTALLAVGDHSISAEYGGDASFSGAISPGVPHHVDKASATISVTASAQRSFLGQTVVFTVTMAASTSGTPTGTMTLKDGATTLGSCTLIGHLCTLAISTLATGRHAITAEYSGDAHFDAANSPAVTLVVLTRVYLPLIAVP